MRATTMKMAAALLTLLALAGGNGCGAASVASRPDPRHDRLEELQREEARLQHAQDELDTLDPAACPDRCRATASICDASTRICVIARELENEGAMARCDRAEAMCREANEVTTACGCAGSPADAGTV